LSDFADLSLGQFGVSVAFAALAGPVNKFVGVIFSAGFPRQMTFGNASEISFPARMRRLMFGRRRPINVLADQM
jgi:hypothetical protein